MENTKQRLGFDEHGNQLYYVEKIVRDRRHLLEIEKDLVEEIDALLPKFDEMYERTMKDYDGWYRSHKKGGEMPKWSRSEMFRGLIVRNAGKAVKPIRQMNRSKPKARLQFQLDRNLENLLAKTADASGMTRSECFRQIVYDAIENL